MLSLVLTSCTSESQLSSPEPTHRGQASSRRPQVTPGATQPPRPVPPPLHATASFSALPTLPHELLPELPPYEVTEPDLHLDVSVPQLSGGRALNRQLRETADTFVRSFRKQARLESRSRPHRYHALTVGWQLLGVSKQSVGIQLWVAQQHGLDVSIDRVAVWYDRQTRAVISLPDLFTSSAWPAARNAILEAAKQHRTAHRRLASAMKAGERNSIQRLSFGFAADGSLLVTPSSTGAGRPLSIRLAGGSLTPRLTAAGRSARTAARTPPRTRRAPVDCAKRRCVALTFDDGPGSYTAELVAMLEQRRAPATFFLVGDRVRQASDLVATMKAAGMEIGNHSTHHDELTFVSAGPMRTDLETTSRAIEAVTGQLPVLMRPPYGSRNRTVDRVSGELGMAEILWDVDTLDWRTDSPARIRRAAVGAATTGSIILMHDLGRGTVAAVPDVLADLQRKGFTLVTVSELLGRRIEPGGVYRRRVESAHQ